MRLHADGRCRPSCTATLQAWCAASAADAILSMVSFWRRSARSPIVCEAGSHVRQLRLKMPLDTQYKRRFFQSQHLSCASMAVVVPAARSTGIANAMRKTSVAGKILLICITLTAWPPHLSCASMLVVMPGQAHWNCEWVQAVSFAGASFREVCHSCLFTACQQYLSCASMPVVVPAARSTGIAKAVRIASSFCGGGTSSGSCSRCRSSPRIPTHTQPLVSSICGYQQ